LLVERHGLRIALLGYCEVFLPSYQAEKDLAGVAWSEHDDEVLADIRAAHEKYKADIVIPFLHWGCEYMPATDRQKTFARRMIDAGADVVVGAHPHVTQDVAYYRGHLIVYSLGNFLFNGFRTEACHTGWALRLTVDRHGLVAWDTIVARLDLNQAKPERLCWPFFISDGGAAPFGERLAAFERGGGLFGFAWGVLLSWVSSRGGPERPDSGFGSSHVNTSADRPGGRTRPTKDSNPAGDTPIARPSSQSGKAAASLRSRTS
jgi:hypothetical protein